MKTLRLTYQLIAIPAAFSLSACHTQSSQQQPTPPNIIYILADDMGYGDINAFNPHSQIPTPTLDSMASAGIMFTDAHSNSSVSTPTRYGTLTGRYAFRSSLKKGVLTGYSSPLIEKGRETIASFLSNQGYQTACIGKWHLGLDWVKKDAKKPLFTGNEERHAHLDEECLGQAVEQHEYNGKQYTRFGKIGGESASELLKNSLGTGCSRGQDRFV